MKKHGYLVAAGLLALLVATSQCFASAGVAGLNTGDGFNYDWGSIGYEDDFNGPAAGTAGTKLVFSGSVDPGGGAVAVGLSYDWGTIDDYIIDDSTALGGEYWDVEALLFHDDNVAGKYRILAVVSTSADLYWVTNSLVHGIGDLAINGVSSTPGTHTAATTYTAGMGVKLAGSAQGKVKKNVGFGWGIKTGAGYDDAQWRNPGYMSGLSNPSGTIPYASTNVDFPSNFRYDGSDDGTADVIWKTVFDEAYDTDGPGTTTVKDQLGNVLATGLDTYAIEVTIDHSVFNNQSIKSLHLAPSCLNDGISTNAPGLPPGILLSALPVLGLAFRRFRRH